MAQFFVNKNQWNFKLIENKKNNTTSAKWTIGAGRKKKKHNVELIRYDISSSSGLRLSQIVLDGNMIYETVDNQSQFELNIGKDEIDILISPQNTKYYLYINGNEYNDIIHDNLAMNIKNTKWQCTSCRHKNYTHSKHCRLCRRKKRNNGNKIHDIKWSNNPLPPPPPSIPHHIVVDINDIPPPPPLPPVSIEEKYYELLKRQTSYERIINKQKKEILQLKQKLIVSETNETVETSKKRETMDPVMDNEDSKQRNAMLKFMVEVQEKVMLFEKSIHQITAVHHEIDKEKKNGLKLIDHVFNSIITKIKQRKTELVKKLEMMTKIKKNILKAQHKELEQKLQISTNLKSELQKILDGDDTNESVTKEGIASKRNKLMKLQDTNDGIQKVSSHLQFDFNSDYEHLLHSIASFGNITTTKPMRTIVKKEETEQKKEQWDGEIIGDHLIITDENSVTCTEKECYSYRTCFGSNIASSNTHHWRLKIKEINHDFCAWNMLIGVMKLQYCDKYNDKQSKLFRKNNHFTTDKSGYGFVGNLNFLTCGSHKDRNYGQKLKINDIVDIYLDLSKLTLCYKINDIGCGIAYKNIEKASYCLAVSFCGTSNQIEIIKYNHEKYKLMQIS